MYDSTLVFRGFGYLGIRSALLMSLFQAGGIALGHQQLGNYPLCEASAALQMSCPGSDDPCLLVRDNEQKDKLFVFPIGVDGHLQVVNRREMDLGSTSEGRTRGSQWHRRTDVLPMSVKFHRWSLGFGQSGPPYRTGVAGPCHTRLLTFPAFQPGSCSLALSGLGKAVASQSITLNSGPLRGQCSPCVPWRTPSLYSGSV